MFVGGFWAVTTFDLLEYSGQPVSISYFQQAVRWAMLSCSNEFALALGAALRSEDSLWARLMSTWAGLLYVGGERRVKRAPSEASATMVALAAAAARSSAAEAGKRGGCRGETPRTPPAAGEVGALIRSVLPRASAKMVALAAAAACSSAAEAGKREVGAQIRSAALSLAHPPLGGCRGAAHVPHICRRSERNFAPCSVAALSLAPKESTP
jgi:hypothetical protein